MKTTDRTVARAKQYQPCRKPAGARGATAPTMRRAVRARSGGNLVRTAKSTDSTGKAVANKRSKATPKVAKAPKAAKGERAAVVREAGPTRTCREAGRAFIAQRKLTLATLTMEQGRAVREAMVAAVAKAGFPPVAEATIRTQFAHLRRELRDAK